MAVPTSFPLYRCASACKAADKATSKITRIRLSPGNKNVAPDLSGRRIAVGTGAIQFWGNIGLRRTGELVSYLCRQRQQQWEPWFG